MAGSIEVRAIEEGTWGDRLTIEVLEGSLDPENSFNLIVRYKGETGFFAFDEIDALNMVAVPGVTTAEVIHAGIAYAENRQDLMPIGDTPLTLKTLS